MWIVIDRDYATYSARTWRAAMDLVSPPAPMTASGLATGVLEATDLLVELIRKAEEHQ
jgi:hypothetical protein